MMATIASFGKTELVERSDQTTTFTRSGLLMHIGDTSSIKKARGLTNEVENPYQQILSRKKRQNNPNLNRFLQNLDAKDLNTLKQIVSKYNPSVHQNSRNTGSSHNKMTKDLSKKLVQSPQKIANQQSKYNRNVVKNIQSGNIKKAVKVGIKNNPLNVMPNGLKTPCDVVNVVKKPIVKNSKVVAKKGAASLNRSPTTKKIGKPLQAMSFDDFPDVSQLKIGAKTLIHVPPV